jgi:hypothetical protein
MSRRFATLTMLAIALSVRPAGVREAKGQSAPHLQKASASTLGEKCSTNDKTDAAERSALGTYSSPALEEALLSGKSFWSFITDPSTPYMDRLAAAIRGGSMLSPEELPLLWEAMAEISSVPSGVNPPPCSAVAITFPPLSLNTPRNEASRVVLGREIQLPTENIEFPITAEERDHSPWLWQVNKALAILFDKVNAYYGDSSRYTSRVKAAWGWPISVPTYHPGEIVHDFQRAEWNKIYIRSRALTEGAPHDTLLLQTILKLAQNNDNYNVAYTGHVQDLYAWGQDSYHYEELAHVAQIAILQKTRWENIASETAFVMASLATQKGNPLYVPNLKPLKTATGILAIGRWAMDKSINPWNRYYGFVQPICRIMDDAPCPSLQLREPSDPRLDDSLKMFEAWFERKKPELKQQAESEWPHLDSLAKELHTDTARDFDSR